MSHRVHIVDPWFGAYYKLTGAPSAYIQPKLTFGPGYIRVARFESLDKQGNRKTVKGFHERPVQHSWLGGTIKGVVPELSPSGGQFYTDLLGCDKTNSYNIPKGTITIRCIVIPTETFVSQDKGYLQLAITFEITSVLGGSTLHATYGVVAGAECNVDSDSGSISYGPFRIVRVWGAGGSQCILSTTTNPYGAGGDSLGSQMSSLPGIVQEARKQLDSVWSHTSGRDASIYDALENVSLWSVNWLETCKDLAEPLSAIQQLIGFFRGNWSVLGIIRKMASFHLFWKYVIKTGILTAKELRKMFRFLLGNWGSILKQIQEMYMFGRGRKIVVIDAGTDSRVTHCTKLCYAPNVSGLRGLLDRLTLLRVTPRLGDLWDIVPWSFVIDWLLPVQDYLDHMEEMLAHQALPLLYCVLSKKATTTFRSTFKVGEKTFEVTLNLSRYERNIETSLPPDVWLGITFRDPRKQAVTATSLIVQLFT